MPGRSGAWSLPDSGCLPLMRRSEHPDQTPVCPGSPPSSSSRGQATAARSLSPFLEPSFSQPVGTSVQRGKGHCPLLSIGPHPSYLWGLTNCTHSPINPFSLGASLFFSLLGNIFSSRRPHQQLLEHPPICPQPQQVHSRGGVPWRWGLRFSPFLGGTSTRLFPVLCPY